MLRLVWGIFVRKSELVWQFFFFGFKNGAGVFSSRKRRILVKNYSNPRQSRDGSNKMSQFCGQTSKFSGLIACIFDVGEVFSNSSKIFSAIWLKETISPKKSQSSKISRLIRPEIAQARLGDLCEKIRTGLATFFPLFYKNFRRNNYSTSFCFDFNYLSLLLRFFWPIFVYNSFKIFSKNKCPWF